MKDNDKREIALEKEINTIKLAQTISSLFAQIPTEIEFIKVLKNEIPDSEVASLLWHTLKEQDESLSILYGKNK